MYQEILMTQNRKKNACKVSIKEREGKTCKIEVNIGDKF